MDPLTIVSYSLIVLNMIYTVVSHLTEKKRAINSNFINSIKHKSVDDNIQ